MTRREPHGASSVRRRPSFSLRARSRTVTGSSAIYASQTTAPVFRSPWTLHQDSSCGLDVDWKCDNPYLESRLAEHASNAAVVEEMDDFPDPVPRRRGAKSFSHLRHPVDGLLSLGRRLSISIRSKSSKHATTPSVGDASHNRRVRGGSWDARSKDAEQVDNGSINHRRPSLSSVSALHTLYRPTDVSQVPALGRRPEPFALPEWDHAGAATRAAAAAQNKSSKVEWLHLRTVCSSLIQDSESGIGIDLRDQSETEEFGSTLVRIDPLSVLPSEIMAQILSYLTPESLGRAELVSRSWRQQTMSPSVWRQVFHRSYYYSANCNTATKKQQGLGLGKTIPNQDWKKIFLVRRALDQRWKEGKAAAIYLTGHTDSVYCAQFDEHKIITGSRDRTIRVWDAHYPWACRKVIGLQPEGKPATGPVNNRTQQSPGKSPFATICPPTTLPPAGNGNLPGPMTNHHSSSILCLQFDEEILVTGSSDSTCIVWDIQNDYQPIRRLEGHRAGVLDVCFDDRYIVSCSKDTTVCVWDRHTGALLKKLLGHHGPVNSVQLRGEFLVTASGDGLAKLWNITSGQCVKEFRSTNRGLACVEFSDDARTVLIGGNDQMIHQFDANTGDLSREFKGHTELVRSLHLDGANQRIISGSYDASVKIFDAQSGELSVDMPGWTTSWILSVKADYRRILATSQDSRAVIIDFGYGLDGVELLEG